MERRKRMRREGGREREVCSCMWQLHASQYYSPNSVPSYPSSAYAQSLPSCCQVLLISPACFEKSSFVPSTVLIWNIELARTRRNLYFFEKKIYSITLEIFAHITTLCFTFNLCNWEQMHTAQTNESINDRLTNC